MISLNPSENLHEGGIIIILHFTEVKMRHKKVKQTTQNQGITQAKKVLQPVLKPWHSDLGKQFETRSEAVRVTNVFKSPKTVSILNPCQLL